MYYCCYTIRTVNHDINVALNSCGFSYKNDSWKSSVNYFMRICNTGVLLVSNGKSRVI